MLTMTEEKVDTYSTKVDPQKPLDIPNTDDDWNDVLNEDGVIPTTLNVEVMVQRVAKDIYKNATSGIRELYMNAVEGCLRGVEMFGYENPHVTVTINEAERIIIIEDNGRGITKARFKQVLRELGTSDNHSGKRTGQFGMGFASYMTLASVCVLDTIGDNGDNYKMLCRDGTSSKPSGKADLESHGVKLTLTCYESVDFEEVCKKLYDTARHASVPTTVIMEEFDYLPDNFENGTNEIEQVSFEDDGDSTEVDEKVIRIDHEDFTLLVCDSITYRKNVYLLNVPIDSKIEVPFNWWALNIKDERKNQPMPDRDRMREEADKSLQKLVDIAIREHFMSITINTYSQYIESERKTEYVWLIEHTEYAPEHLRPRLEELATCRHLRAVDYTPKSKLSTHSLKYWLDTAGDGGITYQGHKSKPHTDKVMQYLDNGCKLIIAKKSKNDKWQDSVQILEDWGVPTVKGILKDNKVKMPKITREESDLRTIIGHEHNPYYGTNEYYYDDIGDNCVRVDSMKMSKMISFVRGLPTDMVFMRNEPALKDTDCQLFSEWINDFKTVEVLTNQGLLTAETIAQTPNMMYCGDITPEQYITTENIGRLVILDKTKVLGVFLIKYLEYNDGHTQWISQLIGHEYIDKLFKDKFGVSLYNQEAMNFFCNHISEIKEPYRELFGRILKHCSDGLADSVAGVQYEKYFNEIKEYETLEQDDEIGKLKFFHSKWQNLPNKTAGITVIFNTLIRKSKNIIQDNTYLRNRFVREEVLPTVFDSVEIRKCVAEDMMYGLGNFDVSFTTTNRTLQFNDKHKIYGMEVNLLNIGVRIFNQHSLITGEMVVTD